MELKKLLEVMEANPEADLLFYFDDGQIFINPNISASYGRQTNQSRKVIHREIVKQMAEKEKKADAEKKNPPAPVEPNGNAAGKKTEKIEPEGSKNQSENAPEGESNKDSNTSNKGDADDQGLNNQPVEVDQAEPITSSEDDSNKQPEKKADTETKNTHKNKGGKK